MCRRQMRCWAVGSSAERRKRLVRLNLVTHVADNDRIAGRHSPVFPMEPVRYADVSSRPAAFAATTAPFFPLEPTRLRAGRTGNGRLEFCARGHRVSYTGIDKSRAGRAPDAPPQRSLGVTELFNRRWTRFRTRLPRPRRTGSTGGQ